MNIPLYIFAWAIPVILIWMIGVLAILNMKPSRPDHSDRRLFRHSYTADGLSRESYLVSYRSGLTKKAVNYMPAYVVNRAPVRRQRY